MPYNSSSNRPRRGGSPSRIGASSYRPRHNNSRGGKSKGGGAYINPAKFVNAATPKADEVVYQAKHKFIDFPFSEALQKNIAVKKYETPTPVQDQSIPAVLEGRDVIALANTGTGKTAAFLLPIIERMTRDPQSPTVLIMAPTRELAQQIDAEFRDYTYGMKLYSAVVVGGVSMDRQIRDLRRRPHAVIGTPGRLKDLITRKHLRLDRVETLVLDEADRMLDMGFLNDIKTIIAQTPTERQTLFFSATITPEIQIIISTILRDPVTVSVRTSETSEHVEQTVIEATDKDHKIRLLTDLLSQDDYGKVLVFGETKFGVQRLSDRLDKDGIPSAAIHGNKSQGQRQRALKDFRDEKVRVLVATDVAARGLDIPNVTHVINFDQPKTYEDYIHRIGRTGRGGAQGTAHTFISKR